MSVPISAREDFPVRLQKQARAQGQTRHSENGVSWLAVTAWSGFDWLWHGFSTRQSGLSRAYQATDVTDTSAGELNLGFTAADSTEIVRENRRRLVEAVTGSRETPLVTVRQVHSRVSVLTRDADATFGAAPPEADGILTNQRGILLGIQTADCIPVLVADPVRRAVGAFHAGWRGTVERIVELGIRQMQEEFGSDAAQLVAAIGPGIGPCCYIVGDEVLARFDAAFAYSRELFSADAAGDDWADSDGTSKARRPALRLDLIEANRRQLLTAGLDAGSIAIVGGCTACQRERFFSHRASQGHAGRMMAVIGIRQG